SGVDCALVVTEPTLSGLHDADRVIKVAKHFNVLTKLIINKYDLNPDMTGNIEKYCRDNDIQVLGKIAFDKSIVDAMVNAMTIIEYKDGKAKKEISNIWDKVAANKT
ncbi:MAG: (4Fe-4S)-binding protein, partial [Candidatus Omnitrophica bacterium]|nr:(4Fe-4S)-binding protein [Candidatus Omnitrophota bacterium]